jgi:hypothetical protein
VFIFIVSFDISALQMQIARSFSTLKGVRLRLRCCCLLAPRPPPPRSSRRVAAGHGCDADGGATTTTTTTGALDGCGGGGGVRRDERLKFSRKISLFRLHEHFS